MLLLLLGCLCSSSSSRCSVHRWWSLQMSPGLTGMRPQMLTMLLAPVVQVQLALLLMVMLVVVTGLLLVLGLS